VLLYGNVVVVGVPHDAPAGVYAYVLSLCHRSATEKDQIPWLQFGFMPYHLARWDKDAPLDLNARLRLPAGFVRQIDLPSRSLIHGVESQTAAIKANRFLALAPFSPIAMSRTGGVATVFAIRLAVHRRRGIDDRFALGRGSSGPRQVQADCAEREQQRARELDYTHLTGPVDSGATSLALSSAVTLTLW
jgi:hypothetical protein